MTIMPGSVGHEVEDLAPDGLHVVEINPHTDSRWNAFLASHPEALVFHHAAYLQALQEEYDQRAVNLACVGGDGSIRAVLPLLCTRGLPANLAGIETRRRLSSLPRTPIAGPLARDSTALAAVVEAAVEQVRAQPNRRLELRMWSTELDGVADAVQARHFRTSYVLSLPEHADMLRFGNSRNHASIRRAVNKATRMGVHVRAAESNRDLREWYRIYLDTMRWHAAPPRPYRFFQRCWDLLQPAGLMQLLLAEQMEAGRSKIIAGSIFLMFGQTVFYFLNGRRVEALSARPNDAIHWRAIHDACSAGFRRYDLGEVALENEGLAQFKTKWGTEPKEMYRYYFPPLPEQNGSGLRPDSSSRRLAKAVYRRLPLGVVAAIGERTYSYL